MRYLTIVLLSSFASVAFSADEAKKEDKGLNVDRIECSWDKTSDEAKEKCKPDPSKPTMGQRLDTQLSKDAKTLKNFFGIKGGPEDSKKEETTEPTSK